MMVGCKQRFTYNGEYALQREAIVAIVFEEKIRIDSEVRKLISVC